MNRLLDGWLQNARSVGIDIHQLRHSLRGVPAYLRDLSRVRAEGEKAGWPFPIRALRTCLADRHAPGEVEANFGCHYGCGVFELTKR